MPTTASAPPTRAGRLLAVIIPLGVLLWFAQFSLEGDTPLTWQPLADLILGSGAIVAVVFRRRAPFLISALCTVAASASGLAYPAAVVAFISLAKTRRWPAVAVVAGLGVASATIWQLVVPLPDDLTDWWLVPAILPVHYLVLAGIGLYLAVRRDLATARLDTARTQERARIAHEMHDVLAHRISLIALHAGAMTYRTDLGPDELRGTARLVSDNARQALTDLRGVLGVLRDPAFGGGEPLADEPPQPTLADLAQLIEEAGALGAVTLSDERPAAELGVTTSRTAYRVVQEGLTNARKHAPGAPISVLLAGDPRSVLVVEITNPSLQPAFGRIGSAPLPGSGVGLTGLGERTALLGGRLWHGVTPEGDFRLRVELPWTAA